MTECGIESGTPRWGAFPAAFGPVERFQPRVRELHPPRFRFHLAESDHERLPHATGRVRVAGLRESQAPPVCQLGIRTWVDLRTLGDCSLHLPPIVQPFACFRNL